MKFLILLSVAVPVICLERVARYRYRDSKFLRDYFPTDIVYLISTLIVAGWLSVNYVQPALLWVDTNTAIPRIAEINLPFWVALILALALFDFGNYVTHYLLHMVKSLWDLHKIHHSALLVDWLATFRSHLFEQVLRHVAGPILLIVVGFRLDVAAIVVGFYAAFAVFNHSNLKWGLKFLDPIFITPRLHRMHHLPNKYAFTNYGTVFSIWDRLFGTLALDDVDMSVTGVPGEIDTFPQSFVPQFFEPLRRMKTRWTRPKRRPQSTAGHE